MTLGHASSVGLRLLPATSTLICITERSDALWAWLYACGPTWAWGPRLEGHGTVGDYCWMDGMQGCVSGLTSESSDQGRLGLCECEEMRYDTLRLRTVIHDRHGHDINLCARACVVRAQEPAAPPRDVRTGDR